MPFTDYLDLVVSMPAPVRTLIGLTALQDPSARRAGRAIDKLREEVEGSRSTVLVTGAGAVVRVVSLVVLRVEDGAGRIFTQLGRWDGQDPRLGMRPLFFAIDSRARPRIGPIVVPRSTPHMTQIGRRSSPQMHPRMSPRWTAHRPQADPSSVLLARMRPMPGGSGPILERSRPTPGEFERCEAETWSGIGQNMARHGPNLHGVDQITPACTRLASARV